MWLYKIDLSRDEKKQARKIFLKERFFRVRDSDNDPLLLYTFQDSLIGPTIEG